MSSSVQKEPSEIDDFVEKVCTDGKITTDFVELFRACKEVNATMLFDETVDYDKKISKELLDIEAFDKETDKILSSEEALYDFYKKTVFGEELKICFNFLKERDTIISNFDRVMVEIAKLDENNPEHKIILKTLNHLARYLKAYYIRITYETAHALTQSPTNVPPVLPFEKSWEPYVQNIRTHQRSNQYSDYYSGAPDKINNMRQQKVWSENFNKYIASLGTNSTKK